MRDLEELAALACEENERLERELAELRDENAELRRRLATSQPFAPPVIVAHAQSPAAARAVEMPAVADASDSTLAEPPGARKPFTWDVPGPEVLAPSGFDDADALPKKSNGWKLAAVGAAGLVGVILLALHPWSVPPAVVVTPPAPVAPVAVAPPAPVVTPVPVAAPAPVVVPKVAAAPAVVVPKVAPPQPSIPKVAAAPARRHAKAAKKAKHVAAATKKKHGGKKMAKADWSAKDDPLSGTGF